ncbi:MAG: CaiB/BaiF CoA-transferase family protein [Pseudomonadota bacterium]
MPNLSDILVVTIEQAVAAPYCSCRLADAGARVIKVEREGGDFARQYDDVVDGESAYFVCLNRGKESLVLDIKNTEDKALLKNIVAQADVFIQNLAPGAAQRAGFGSTELCAEFPGLICCDISGYGEHGSYQHMKAYDLLVQCESGLASITGTPEAPGRVGVSVCDLSCGLQAYSAILEALIERDQTGEGCVIQVSLFDSIAELMAVPLLHYDYAEKIWGRVGINHATIMPYGAFETADGQSVVIAIQNEREWVRLSEQVFARPDLVTDERYNNNRARVQNRDALNDIIRPIFAAHTHAEMIDKLKAASIAYGNLNDVAGLSAHPQLRRCGVPTPSGVKQSVSPPALRVGREFEAHAVPALGAHTDAIRHEFS